MVPIFTKAMSSSSYDSTESIFKSVRVYENVNSDTFNDIVNLNEPAIIKGAISDQNLNFWHLDNLNTILGSETIVIHEADQSNLEFLNKNFCYKTCLFKEFVKLLKCPGSKSYYYRSTNRNQRNKKPARIEEDLPLLKDYLHIPEYVPFGPNSSIYFSSILRIALDQVQIWTHFDLYNNVLFQVVGSKRVILFSPNDTEYLHVNGDKSPVNNFDDWTQTIGQYPSLSNTKPYACNLESGCGLYIPALWWHNVKTRNMGEHKDSRSGYSIGFNIFWKDPSLVAGEFYSTSDIYGNKNPTPYDRALSNLDKAINHIESLPAKYRDFYKTMLLIRFKSKLYPNKAVEK